MKTFLEFLREADEIAIRTPPGAEHLPDNDQYTNRFRIKSESSNRTYIVAQNKKTQLWACECPGWKTTRNCKHLKSLGVKTLPGLVRHAIGSGDAASSGKPKKSPLTGYQTHTGTFGNKDEWQDAFNQRMGIDAALKAVGNDSPRGILGVSATADWSQIKTAYRKLVMQYHPDRPGGDAAKFRKIQGAYEVLEDQLAVNAFKKFR